jgi:hypothetical protein
VEAIKRSIVTDVIFNLIIMVFLFYYGKDVSCGIPVYYWILIYFIAYMCQSLSKGVRILLLTH